MRQVAYSLSGLLLLSLAANAQEDKKFTFNIGTGFTQPVGNTERRLDTGWNVNAGAGYNFAPRVAAVVQFDYTQLGINSSILSNQGVPGGGVRIWDFTLDPVVHVMPHKPFDAYIIGGAGVYHSTQEFTAPTTAAVTAFDPFFGFYTAGVPVTQVLRSYTVIKPGVNIGAGVSFGSKWNGKFYAEARYHKIFTGNDRHMDYIPVTFGFRW
ncbi:MAG: outer membrane beta-barrel protein [Acidobacteriota bacterium]|nr:outer membrane beta-barrel protein [Acidobacteriota bacterium]